MWKQYYRDFYEIYLLGTCVDQIIPDLRWYETFFTVESQKVRSGAKEVQRAR